MTNRNSTAGHGVAVKCIADRRFEWQCWAEETARTFGDKFAVLLAESASSTFGELAASAELNPYLPVQWGSEDGQGGPPPDDPLTVYVEIGLDDEDRATHSFSIRDLVEHVIELRAVEDRIEDDDGRQIAIRLRDALRETANRLDAVLK